MGSAATFEGAISDTLESTSLDEVVASDGVEVDQLTDGLPENPDLTPDEEEDPYAGLSPAEIRAKIAEEVAAEKEREYEARKEQALKDQRAALEDEGRQRARLQAEMAEKQRSQLAASAQGRAQAKQAIETVIKQAIDSDTGFDPSHVDGIADWLYRGAKERHFVSDVATPIVNTLKAFPEAVEIHPDFREQWDTGQRTQNPDMLVRAMAASVSRYAYEKGMAAAQAEFAQKAEASGKAAEEAKALKGERRAASGNVQPTNGRGNAARRDTRAILNSARPGTKEYADAHEAEHGIRPPVLFN